MIDHIETEEINMKIKQTINIVWIPVVLTLSLYANKPSFDCSKVEKNSTEGIICSSDVLMDLDRELSNVYKQALKKATKEDMLKAYQRGWIKGRNDCWKAKDEKKCMVESYQFRINELKEKYHLSGTENPLQITKSILTKHLA